MLLGTLGAGLLGNLLWGKGILRADSGNKKGKGIMVMELKWIFSAASFFNKLWNTEIQKYYENEPRFNGVFSRDNMPKRMIHK